MEVDLLKTRDYYRTLKTEALCNCVYCHCYRCKIRSAYPEAAGYLDSLGIDIEKPFETSPLEPDENGMIEYCGCQYIAFGNCEDDHRHRTGDVEFHRAVSYPGTGIQDVHFVLECYPVRLRFSGRSVAE